MPHHPIRIQKIGEGVLLKDLHDSLVDERVNDPTLAVVGTRTSDRVVETIDDANRTYRGGDDLADGQRIRRLCELISATATGSTTNESSVPQRLREVFEIPSRESGSSRDIRKADGLSLTSVACDVEHHSQRISGTGGQPHLGIEVKTIIPSCQL